MSDPEILGAPPTPLEGQLYVTQYSGEYIDNNDLSKILNFLRHDGSYQGPVHHAHGRNVTIPLERPVSRLFDSVQVSGGAFIPMGINGNADLPHSVALVDPSTLKDIQPPAQGNTQFTHTYKIVEGDALVERADKSPMGSYSQKVADRKLAMTLRALQIDSSILKAPHVIGKYEFFTLDDGQGGHPTALLFAVPMKGERTDSNIVSPLASISAQKPELFLKALDDFMPHLASTLFMIGNVAADIHDAGMVHNQLTLGNVLAMENSDQQRSIYVADWETADEIKAGQEDFSKIFDLAIAFRSFTGMIDHFSASSHLDSIQSNGILVEGFISLMSGYARLPVQATAIFAEINFDFCGEALSAIRKAGSNATDYEPLMELIQELQKYRQTLVDNQSL